MPISQIQGQKVYYQHSSPTATNGTTIVLIHGLGSSHAFYGPIVPELIKNDYACLAIDTPGSGCSQPASKDRTPKEIASVISELLNTLSVNVSKSIVVGHSMGGMIASELAVQGVLGSVLIGPVHPSPNLTTVFNQRIETVQKNGLEALADTVPKAATGSLSTPTHHAFIRALILSQTAENYASLCRTIATASAPEYSKVNSPVLVIAGGDDKTSPLEGCQTIVDSTMKVTGGSWGADAKKKLEIVEGVGHWHVIEAPEQVGQLIVDFAHSL
ncbi:alpha/beta hydrolase fold family protein [Emericellopsis atlantica]|uniref:Alpha/beta hydrolase fold family protein n=1 Tax=Emericellopsis atlantica TaxID=2614577 RepID=A0A9P7ZJR1_9HYPO|nr:alpha/beta hydrolase fold family protein [Emericellopsis atlantica]KAG9252981.1 alpha/beta hydrolase fold family protein [Emericellopsis atlantica]